MEFSSFVKELLHISDDFSIVKIEHHTESDDSFIHIYLEHTSDYCEVDGIRYKIYDHAPERTWQHLCWFEYPCFIVCRVPRYIDSDGKVKLLEVSFAAKGKSQPY